ncbi:MAG TPA: hypothetical protein VHQ90_21040 [Thermoanaerobaculia bacterium]|nr:hypothetical protein [Thermoanaerobaculia bacterium]
MKHQGGETREAKIGPEFANRLRRLKPGETVQAILMLATAGAADPPLRGRGREKRAETIASVRAASDAALPAIDRVLARTGGRRLAAHADTLGCLPIETTAAGILELAASQHVKAVLEDQPISLVAHS